MRQILFKQSVPIREAAMISVLTGSTMSLAKNSDVG